MDINRFFNLFYWFSLEPQVMSLFGAISAGSFFGCFILLKILGKFAYLHYKKNLSAPEKRLMAKAESMLLTMGFAGIAWVFFAYEGLPILSARFWFLVWVVAFVLWGYLLLRYALVELPPQISAIKQKERFSKYLPKK
ncbi:hypothetical protein HY627_01855 [Candidatus Uhrbacteria bacterium]|nr:hypothetical protein [Candidatus Uhrbacteria bacterium]